MKLLLMLNSVSGKAQLARQAYQIIEALTLRGYEVTVLPINPDRGLGTDGISESYIGQFDMVVCGGGDGTINHTVNMLLHMEKRPVLGYIPAGSTNDFARIIGIPGTVEDACRVITDGTPFSYDIGTLNGAAFNYVAAFGAFSAISYDTNQQLKNVLGYAAYILSAISELSQNLRYSCHMKIEADSFKSEDDYIFGAVCNSVSVGGMRLFENKDIRLSDGKMEMLLIKAPETVADIPLILNAIGKGELDGPYLSFHKIKEARLVAGGDTAWTVDGEFGGEMKEADIKVHARAITIMAGA